MTSCSCQTVWNRMSTLFCVLLAITITQAQPASAILEQTLQLQVDENVAAGTVLGSIERRSGYSYRLNDRNVWFELLPQSGQLVTRQRVDREQLDGAVQQLVVVASAPAPKQPYFITIYIRVHDVNDNAPQFPNPFQNLSISESAPLGTSLRIVSASDQDVGVNGDIKKYEISSSQPVTDAFKIHEIKVSDGTIVGAELELIKPLNREQTELFTLTLVASDQGGLQGSCVLFVHVTDSNDNAPVFDQTSYTAVTKLNQPGDPIITLKATDSDQMANSQITYHIDSDNTQFVIDRLSGVLSVNGNNVNGTVFCPACVQSDCVTSRLCIVPVRAQDAGDPPQQTSTFVHIYLSDANEHAPEIQFNIYPDNSGIASVDDSRPNGTIVAVVSVLDADEGDNGRAQVQLDGGNFLNHFRLDSNDLFRMLRVNAPLDSARWPFYNLSFTAVDLGEPPRMSTKYLPVYVRGNTDQPPEFDTPVQTVQLPDYSPKGSYVAAVRARVARPDLRSSIRYKIHGGNEQGMFHIDESSGLITLATTFQRTSARSIELTVAATNAAQQLSTTKVVVNILNVNRFAPEFEQSKYTVSVPENAVFRLYRACRDQQRDDCQQFADRKQNMPIMTLTASDMDSGEAGQVRFSLDPSAAGLFRLTSTGELQVVSALNHTTEAEHMLTVYVTDQGTPSRTGMAQVLVAVLPSALSTPSYGRSTHYANVLRQAPVGSTVITLPVSGANNRVQYAILQADHINAFKLHIRTAQVSVNRLPIGVTKTKMVIGARDSSTQRLLSNTTLNVAIVDSKRQMPVFDQSSYQFTVQEDITVSGIVSGKLIGKLGASVNSDQQQIEYSISSGNEHDQFTIGTFNGLLSSSQTLDYEQTESYDLVVTAKSDVAYQSVPVHIQLTDLNDNAPTFVNLAEGTDPRIELSMSSKSPAGAPVYYATATDPDHSHNGLVQYSIQPESSYFDVDQRTGLVYLVSAAVNMPANMTYSLSIMASDNGRPPRASSLQLVISVNNTHSNEEHPDLSTMYLQIKEDTPINTRLRPVTVPKLDQTRTIRYEMAADSENSAIGVFPDGWLFVREPLSPDTDIQVQVQAIQTLNDGHPVTSYRQVHVNVLDVNDHRPECVLNPFHFRLTENAAPFTHIGSVRAIDEDGGLAGMLLYELASHKHLFNLHVTSGALSTAQTFDRERMHRQFGSTKLVLRVLVTDQDTVKRQTEECSVVVEVLDSNDNEPVFSLDLYTANVLEDTDIGTELLRLTATDADQDENAELRYEIDTASTDQWPFALNPVTGTLVLADTLDREQQSVFKFTVIARDQGSPSLNSSATVQINILDVNDNSPVFSSRLPFGLNVSEWKSAGAILGQVSATDVDMDGAGHISYYITDGNTDSNFGINLHTGELLMIGELDYELTAAYSLTITASDNGNPPRSSSVPIVINVLDENDNAPLIRSVILAVPETAAVGDRVTVLEASDADSGVNAALRYSIQAQQPADLFSIVPTTGALVVRRPLDREQHSLCRVRVLVQDSAINSSQVLSTSRTVNVIIEDVNDNAPIFTGPLAAAVDLDVARRGWRLAQIRVRDEDAGDNGTVRLSLNTEADRSEQFSLEPDNWLVLARAIDNTRRVHRVQVTATDNPNSLAAHRRSSSTTFTLLVTDRNHNRALTFQSTSYELQVSEDQPVGFVIGQVSVDSGQKQDVLYYVTSIQGTDGDMDLMVQVNENTGQLVVKQPLNVQLSGASLVLTVHAVTNDQAHSAHCKVIVNVLDTNDKGPVPDQLSYEWRVSEWAPIGTVLGQVHASDPDTTGSALSYNLQSVHSLFVLDTNTGQLTTRAALDYEITQVHYLTVIVSDGLHQTMVDVQVQVEDENDNAPVFVQTEYNCAVFEDAAKHSFVTAVRGVDRDTDQNARLVYSIVQGDPLNSFTIHPSTGVITVNSQLDHELVPMYRLSVQAEDDGKLPKAANCQVFVFVLDVNDHKPRFMSDQSVTELSEQSPVGTIVTKVHMTDQDSTAEFSYEIGAGDPWSQFVIDADGLITTSDRLDREQRANYQLTIIGYDARNGHLRHSTKTLVTVKVNDVNDKAPVFIDQNTHLLLQRNTSLNTIIGYLNATDSDSDDLILYELDSKDSGKEISVDPVRGTITLLTSVQSVITSTLTYSIWAVDGRNSSLRSPGQLTLHLPQQQLTATPKFSERQLRTSIAEDAPIGTTVAQLAAINSGMHTAVKYWLTNAAEEPVPFTVLPQHGTLIVQHALDYEWTQSYVLQVAVAAPHSDTPADLCQVIVNVTDVNDNRPQFVYEPQHLRVFENMRVLYPVVIGQVQASDPDTGLAGQLAYSLVSGNSSLFSVHSLNAQISLLRALDRESVQQHELVIEATDSAKNRFKSKTTVFIHVLDSNDNVPIFNQTRYQFQVYESIEIGTVIGHVLATDADRDHNGLISYDLIEQPEDMSVQVDRFTGSLTSSQLLDRERRPTLHLLIQATDHGAGVPQSSTVPVTITLLDVNDNAPFIRNPSMDIYVSNSITTGQFVFAIDCVDADEGDNGRLSYRLSGADAASFEIEPSSGVIRALRPINIQQQYALVVHVSDQPLNTKTQHETSTSLNLIIHDSTQFPVFNTESTATLKLHLFENMTDEPLSQIVARTSQSGRQPRYSIINGNLGNAFNIDPDTGILSSTPYIDREQHQQYSLWVAASDQGSPFLSSFRPVQVTVADVNDNAPMFERVLYQVTVPENQLAHTSLVYVKATDGDQADNARVTYSLHASSQGLDRFKVEAFSGQVATTQSLDREEQSTYKIVVQASDNGTPPLASTVPVIVTVMDENDNPPKFRHLFSSSVREDTPVGSFIIQVTSVDADDTQNNTYQLTTQTNTFRIHPSSGNISLVAPLDRETQARHELRVVASDGTWRVQTMVTIDVLDVNDHSPVFTQRRYEFTTAQLLPSLTVIGQVVAHDLDQQNNANSKIVYSIARKSDLFKIDENNGNIQNLKQLHLSSQRKPEMHELRVMAEDRGSPRQRTYANVSILVTGANEHAPHFVQLQPMLAVSQDAAIGSSIYQLQGTDGDGDTVIFSMEAPPDTPFELIGDTGWVRTRSDVGNRGRAYNMNVTVMDRTPPARNSTSSLTIVVSEPNQHAPQFVQEHISLSTSDQSPLGTRIATLNAQDLDTGLNGQVTYTLQSSSTDSDMDLPVHINAQSALLITNQTLLNVKRKIFRFIVVATDLGYPRRSAYANVSLTIEQSRTVAPRFTISNYELSIDENSPGGTLIGRVQAQHQQEDTVQYRIVSGNMDNYFKIHPVTGELSTSNQAVLDYEKVQQHSITVLASSQSDHTLNDTTKVTINILSRNEFAPECSETKFEFTVDENSQVGTEVGRVVATDQDLGRHGQVLYAFDQPSSGTAFAINKTTGMVTVRSPLKQSAYPLFLFKVTVYNPDSHSTTQIDHCSLTIRLQQTAVLPTWSQQQFTVQCAEDKTVGTVITQLVLDTAPNRAVLFDMIDHTRTFEIDDSARVRLKSPLDRETQDEYTVLVTARFADSSLSQQSTAELLVTVNDVNDNAPQLRTHSLRPHVLENQPIGTVFAQLQATDPDLNYNGAPFTFSLANEQNEQLFSVDSVTGYLSTNAVLDREQERQYDISIVVRDSGVPQQASTQTLTVLIDDVNDQSPNTEDVSMIVLSPEHSLKATSLGLIPPADRDIVGEYSCDLQRKSSLFSIGDQCDLKVSGSATVPSDTTLQLYGTDGRHSPVNYTAHIQFTLLQLDHLSDLVQITVLGPSDNLLTDWVDEINNDLASRDMSLSVHNVQKSVDHLYDLLVLVRHRSQGSALEGMKAVATLRSLPRTSQYHRITAIHYNLCETSPCANQGQCSVRTLINHPTDMHQFRSHKVTLVSPVITRFYECACSALFGGPHCEHSIDRCALSPCLNGGSCEQSMSSGVHCLCPASFTGKLCEDDVDECLSSPCHNSAFCENTEGSFNCSCLLGYEGRYCEHKVDHCSSFPCMNGGTCVRTNAGFECKCTGAYSGVNCASQTFGFDTSSFVELPPLRPNHNDVRMQFATVEQNALLLYSYNEMSGATDYAALDIVGGRLRLSGSLTLLGQMNMILPVIVNTGHWFQVRIQHQLQTVILSVSECDVSGVCEQCVSGDDQCQITMDMRGAQYLVPGQSLFLGGVRHFNDLLTRPGQTSAFSFRGCIWAFTIDDVSLADLPIRGKQNVLDHCPRPEQGVCESSTCGHLGKCFDRWHHASCLCPSTGFMSTDCATASQAIGFDGGFVVLRPTENYRRSLVFRPVAPESLVNSDDLLRKRHRRATNKQRSAWTWFQIEFRTNQQNGVLFFSTSNNDFTLVDIVNGTVRYLSRVGLEQPIQIRLDKRAQSVADGRWHRVSLEIKNLGTSVSVKLDGNGTDTSLSTQLAHSFVNPSLDMISIGGSQSQIQVIGTVVTGFIGCLRNFVINGEAQLLVDSVNEVFISEVVGQVAVSGSCSANANCDRPPCTVAPFDSLDGSLIAIIATVCFFSVILCVILVAYTCLVLRHRSRAKSVTSSLSADSPPMAKRRPSPLDPVALLSGSAVTMQADSEYARNRPYWYRNTVMTDSSLSVNDTLNRAVGPGTSDSYDRVDMVRSVAGAIPERYDLDNASSIAPSDLDVDEHYRQYHGRPAHDPPSAKQLKAALRASPGPSLQQSLAVGRRVASGTSSEDNNTKQPSYHSSKRNSARSRRSRPEHDQDSSSEFAELGHQSQRLRRARSKSGGRSKAPNEPMQNKRFQNPSFEGDSSTTDNEDRHTHHQHPVLPSVNPVPVPRSLAPFRPSRSMFPVSEDDSDSATHNQPTEHSNKTGLEAYV